MLMTALGIIGWVLFGSLLLVYRFDDRRAKHIQKRNDALVRRAGLVELDNIILTEELATLRQSRGLPRQQARAVLPLRRRP